MEITTEYRKQQTNRITWWGVGVNLMLAVIKTVGGIVGQSQALLADGIHSISDLASDGMVLLAAKQHHLQPHLLDLRNSGDTAGDKSRVVGYGAFSLH